MTMVPTMAGAMPPPGWELMIASGLVNQSTDSTEAPLATT